MVSNACGKGQAVSMFTLDGVVVVREGARRLLWAHELVGGPPPVKAQQWLIAELWPDEAARARIRRQLDARRPVVVVLDHESNVVELPAEHVRDIPEGITVQEDPHSDFVTLTVPLLDWLTSVDRRRGLAFADYARSLIAKTPRLLLPPLLLEREPIAPDEPLRFMHTTGTALVTDELLRDVTRYLFGNQRPGRLRTLWSADVHGCAHDAGTA
jgi:hypothetical protein